MKTLLAAIAATALVAVAAITLSYWSAGQGAAPTDIEARYMTPEDRFLDVAGAQIRIREEGPEDAPALLLLHGFLYSLETWDAWAERLSTDYRVIRYDLLGHGLSGPDPLERYAPQERAAFVGDVLDALGAQQAIVAGNSLGGLAAWRFAAANRARVSALILVAPGGYSINGVSETPVNPPPPMRAFLKTAPEAAVDATLKSLFHDDALATPERAQRLRDMMRRRGNGDALIRSIQKFTLPAPEADLAQITAPTLIIWGDADDVIPAAHAERFKSALGAADLIIYEGVGHIPQEEAADQSAADAMAFLGAVLGTAQEETPKGDTPHRDTSEGAMLK